MIRAELERRPLLILCLGLILGITLVRHPIHLLFLLPAPWILRALFSRGLLVAGLALGALLGPGAPAAPILKNQFVDTRFEVVSVPQVLSFGQSCIIEHSELRFNLLYSGSLQLYPGEVLAIRGVAKPPNETVQGYFESQNLVAGIETRGDSVSVVSDGPWYQRIASGWRSGFTSFASANLSPDLAALESAICFRADGLLSSPARDEIRNTGTIHLVAASGLQVVLVGQTLLWLLSRLPIPRSGQLAILACFLALYALATGLSPSIVRAAVMTLIADSAYLVRREPDWPSALAASSILYLLYDPSGIYGKGFQFTVLAVLFISLFSVHLKWKPGAEATLFRAGVRGIWTGALAWVIVTPLVAYHFGVVSLVSIPSCLAVVVVTVPLIVLSMIALPISWVFPAVGGILLKAAAPLLSVIDSVLGSFGGDLSVLQVPPFSAYWLVLYYILLLLLWRPRVRQV